MKIGPLTITRAQNAAQRSKPDLTEYGAPGTSIFGGQLNQQTDYNPDLMPPQCYDVYDKMRMSDGQVRAALSVVKLPILRAHWQVEPASDSANDRAVAEFIEEDLDSLSTSFISTLRQILLMLDYGSMLFEPVWYVGDDNVIHLRKLAPRLPRSIVQWLVDENGGFAGVKQGVIKTTGYTQVNIPASKLCLFVNEQEGANFRGTSMLRAAYKHWYYKQGLERIDAIANEKRGIGVDIGTIKAGTQADKATLKASLERSLMTLHGHEKQYIIEDEENYAYRLETGGARGGGNAVMTSIEHHDLRILRSSLVEFLGMGSGSTGSLAMHKDKSSLFLMLLEAIADNVADTLSSYLIKPWVGYNWPVTAYPRYKYSRLDTRDTAALATAINQLVSAKTLTPSPDTEKEIRVLMDLPELEAGIAPIYAPPELEIEEDEDENDQMTQMAAALRPVQERQIARLLAEAPALFRAEKPKTVASITVPYRSEIAARVAEGLNVEPELAQIQGRAVANVLAERMKTAFGAEIAAQLRAGEYDEAALSDCLAATIDGAVGAGLRAVA